MPPYLPLHLELVYLSGFFEIALGLLLLVPRFSRLAAWGIIALLIAVFPANIYPLPASRIAVRLRQFCIFSDCRCKAFSSSGRTGTQGQSELPVPEFEVVPFSNDEGMQQSLFATETRFQEMLVSQFILILQSI